MSKTKLKDLQNKKIGILGLGIENKALIDYILDTSLKCKITICDGRSEEELGEKYKELSKRNRIAWRIGKHFNQNLDGFDVVFRSPGWPYFDPEIAKATKLGTVVTSPMRYFFKICLTDNIIGVTGTKGKGTTASLIYAIIKKSRRRVWLGGNIGVAPFSFFKKIKKNDFIVLELSSFQLEDADSSPHIAVITNFSREHQKAADPFNPNYHKSMVSYWNAKSNIFRWQKTRDLLVVNKRLMKRNFSEGNSKIKYFGKSELETSLPGKHNLENIAAAVTVAEYIKIPRGVIKKAVAEFRGLEHRIEFVHEVDHVRYYNDSFATIPESTITALKAFRHPKILIAGGADKGSNFSELALHVKKNVKFVILIKGEASPRIKEELRKIKYDIRHIATVSDMGAAVRKAHSRAKEKDVVLMSPACASFGVFKNYKERGKLFKEEVGNL